MPRNARAHERSIKKQVIDTHRYCLYCKAHRDGRGFDKHKAACKILWQLRCRQESRNEKQKRVEKVVNPSIPIEDELELQVDGDILIPQCLDRGDSEMTLGEVGEPSGSADRFYGPQLPEVYIKIIPHPHSSEPATIVPLSTSSNTSLPSSQTAEVYFPAPESRPWAPFRSLADFEYTETAVKGLLSKDLVNKQLAGFHGKWSIGGSHLTLHTYKDMQDSLEKAREYGVQFKSDKVSATYHGQLLEFEFQHRDPWEYILSLIHDTSLASVSCWNSVRKLYCCGDIEERIIDEPNTADTWWDIDSSLPNNGPYPHCYLPLHFWLDKGMVTRRVKKYPMVLRAAWLPKNIRNASGNGGGILLGYMPIIEDPAHPSDRGSAETLEFAQFKREVYQKILSRVFASLGRRSRHGEANRCNDGMTRILYPGILIESQDGEEASYFCACRAATANYPCPKCLVHKSELHCITKSFEPRTSESMRSVLERASQATSKTAKEKILQEHGLHDIKHFLWDFRFSDPYLASSYDTLHSDDLGKWGKHIWELVLKVLEDRRGLGQLTLNMSKFPAWNKLKHFNHVSTISFTDGQSFYDILKCILPCIVRLLPRNSPLIHCIRAYQCYRIMIGLRCMTDRRLEYLEGLIKEYERYCSKVSKEYEKNFDFFKQHYVSHVISDIRQKGTTDNTSTRPGEGFQQEAAQAYKQTSKKEAEKQMVRIDGNQEAIALIRMAIDDDDKARTLQAQVDIEDCAPKLPSDLELQISGQRWTFGSCTSGTRLDSRELEKDLAPTNRDFVSLDERLRSFIVHNFPEEALRYEDLIYVQSFKCLKITYQSMEDWTEACDILRCNSNFHQRERYDCIIINDDTPGTSVARLRSLLRCRLPSGKVVDIALVYPFARSNWKPYTMWNNCQISAEARTSSFVLLDYVVRGALLCPVFDSDARLHYLVDTVDGDMFLRVNNLT